MNITQFEPWGVVNLLQRDLRQFAGRHSAVPPSGTPAHRATDWLPAVDIIEDKDRFLLRADVPGVNPEDIDVSMENGTLSLSGERHSEATEEEHGLRRIERRSGKFFRSFDLPDTANAEQISASSTNGILEIVIPKQAEVQPRRITVQAA